MDKQQVINILEHQIAKRKRDGGSRSTGILDCKIRRNVALEIKQYFSKMGYAVELRFCRKDKTVDIYISWKEEV